jgi:hypothetical protein
VGTRNALQVPQRVQKGVGTGVGVASRQMFWSQISPGGQSSWLLHARGSVGKQSKNLKLHSSPPSPHAATESMIPKTAPPIPDRLALFMHRLACLEPRPFDHGIFEFSKHCGAIRFEAAHADATDVFAWCWRRSATTTADGRSRPSTPARCRSRRTRARAGRAGGTPSAPYECWTGIQYETNADAAGRRLATTQTGPFRDTADTTNCREDR